MKKFIPLSLVVVAVIAISCSTMNKSVSPKFSAAETSYNVACRNIDAQTAAQKSSIVAVPGVFSLTDVEILKARLDSLSDLKKQKAQIDARFQLVSEQNAGKANRIGYYRTALGWSGVFTGIAAAALTVASPANAVWIAVLSGYSGGIAGMNTVLDNNGLSRTQVAQLAASAVKEFNEVSTSINFGELTVCAVSTGNGCSNADWEKKFAEQQLLVMRLQGILFALNVPTLSTKELRKED